MSSDSIMTVALVAGEVLVLAPIARRRIWRVLPVFSAYLVWALLSDLAGLYFQHPGSTFKYLTFYKLEMVVDSVLMFTVLVELSWSVLRPVRSSLPRGTLVALVVLIAVAGLLVWPLAGMMVTSPQMGPEGATIFHLLDTFAILRVVCFLVMASFSQLLSIGWRDRELQIATGFGFYAIASLFVALLQLHMNQAAGTAELKQQYNLLEAIVSGSYVCSLLYWSVCFAQKAPERREFTPQMQKFLLAVAGNARGTRVAMVNSSSESERDRRIGR